MRIGQGAWHAKGAGRGGAALSGWHRLRALQRRQLHAVLARGRGGDEAVVELDFLDAVGVPQPEEEDGGARGRSDRHDAQLAHHLRRARAGG